MKLNQVFPIMTLNESDSFITEMANFLADVTDLPANIVLWTKTQPEERPHTKYRIKVFKDRVHSATFSISKEPDAVEEVQRGKYRLDGYETNEVKKVVSEFSSLFISYVDGKLTDRQVKEEIKKIKGIK